MMQLGIHAVDLVHYLLGPIISVFAHARAITTSAGVVDNVVAAFTLGGGELGTLVSNYCTPVEFNFRIAGTEGALSGTPLVAQFTPRDIEATPEVCDTSANGFASYAAQMQAFADAVRERTEPETDGWAGLQALAVVEAMAESITRRASIDISLLRPTPTGHAL
jgi:predicted dehydrogenase